MFRHLVILIACLSLVGCGGPRPGLVVDPSAAAVGQVESVYFATTRAPEPGTGDFGPGRSSRVSYGKIDVSVPPTRTAGQIYSAPAPDRADPQRDFVAVNETAYPSEDAFTAELARAIRANSSGSREVAIFIHGYNVNFAESVYRFAQLRADLRQPAVSVEYAWPSAARALHYAYDRDSVLFARDGLETLIEDARNAGARRIILVAHSMGGELTMEVLRQLAIGHRHDLLDRIGGVVLVQPDIDTQVFRRQAKRIGKLPQPFLIFVSDRDRVLALSALLTGRSDRVGNLKDLEKVAELPVTVIDVSAFSTGSDHFIPGNSPTLIAMLGGMGSLMAAFDQPGGRLPLPGISHILHRATEVIVRPDLALGMDEGG